MANKKITPEGIPTIDVALFEMEYTEGEDTVTMAIDTSNQVAVETQSETTDAIKLLKLGTLLAQKPSKTTITGMQLTITDNVFTPEQALILQGGTIEKDSATGKIKKYSPPVIGSKDSGKVFISRTYSAIYDESGEIVGYEKISYPNCKGNPVSLSVQDDTFRAPEYVIVSAPKKGQAPYVVEYIDELPSYDITPGDNQAMATSVTPNAAPVSLDGSSLVEEGAKALTTKTTKLTKR